MKPLLFWGNIRSHILCGLKTVPTCRTQIIVKFTFNIVHIEHYINTNYVLDMPLMNHSYIVTVPLNFLKNSSLILNDNN